MCVSPVNVQVVLPSGRVADNVRACGQCWSCQRNRMDDWVGRSTAEAQVSDWVDVVTLTYRDTPPQEGVLAPERFIHKEHFQTFIRRLRRRGHKIRYLACGEYGTRFGRAHFHAVLFGQGSRPEWPHKERFHVPKVWPWGHMFTDRGPHDPRAFSYVAKYLRKQGDREVWWTCSKKPPLGAAMVEELAFDYAEKGIWPRTLKYRVPGYKPEPLLTGASRRRFFGSLLHWWNGPLPSLSAMSEQVRIAFEAWQLAEMKQRAREWMKENPEAAFDQFMDEVSRNWLSSSSVFTLLSQTYGDDMLGHVWDVARRRKDDEDE